jgi:hypothetical protein
VAAAELRDFARRSLPAYMIPSSFVWLDNFPLTPNGKIDRRSARAGRDNRGSAASDAPRNDTEKLIADVWAQVLGTGRPVLLDGFLASTRLDLKLCCNPCPSDRYQPGKWATRQTVASVVSWPSSSAAKVPEAVPSTDASSSPLSEP